MSAGARQIVHRRPEPARDKHDIRPRQRQTERLQKPRGVIPDGAFEIDVDPHFAQPARQELRVRVDDVAQKDLRADGENLRFHRTPSIRTSRFFMI